MNGTALKILKSPYNAGTQVTNCVVHAGLDWELRPRTCGLCHTDMVNHISRCHNTNEFLNKIVCDATKVLERGY